MPVGADVTGDPAILPTHCRQKSYEETWGTAGRLLGAAFG